jgi:hypothetical protein
MFCANCGAKTLDDSQFCRKCGQGLAVSATSAGAGAAVAPARIAAAQVAQKKRSLSVWAVVGLVLLGVVGAVWLIQNTTSKPLPSPQMTQTRQPQLHTEATGDKAFTVNAGGVYYYKFEVPAGAYNVSFKGHFSATGGSGNDIEAYLLTEDDLVNWENGHSVKTLYNSGRVTQESVNLALPSDAAKYRLVFNNKFSLLTPKAVQADVTLSYYTR